MPTIGTESGQVRSMRQNQPVNRRTIFKSQQDPMFHAPPAHLSVSVLCVKITKNKGLQGVNLTKKIKIVIFTVPVLVRSCTVFVLKINTNLF